MIYDFEEELKESKKLRNLSISGTMFSLGTSVILLSPYCANEGIAAKLIVGIPLLSCTVAFSYLAVSEHANIKTMKKNKKSITGGSHDTYK